MNNIIVMKYRLTSTFYILAIPFSFAIIVRSKNGALQ